MVDYVKWTPTSGTQNPYNDLMSRTLAENWLYDFFFKTALATERLTKAWSLVHSLLNLTSFFHLLQHLHQVGYLAHWLSAVLANILEN